MMRNGFRSFSRDSFSGFRWLFIFIIKRLFCGMDDAKVSFGGIWLPCQILKGCCSCCWRRQDSWAAQGGCKCEAHEAAFGNEWREMADYRYTSKTCISSTLGHHISHEPMIHYGSSIPPGFWR